MANQKNHSKTEEKNETGLRKRDDAATAEARERVSETWPVHAQPGAKEDARIAGKPGATSRD